jgi:hypothetical protein
MPVSGLVQAVPGHQYGPRLLTLIETQKEVGEAEDGATAFVAAAADGLGQGVIGAVGKRVAIDDQEGADHLALASFWCDCHQPWLVGSTVMVA